MIGTLIQRWPIIIIIGSIFLGWTAGEMVIADKQTLKLVDSYSWLNLATPSIFALIVAVVGQLFSNKKQHM